MELIIHTPLETQLPKEIDWNHEQIKTEITESLKKYNNLVYDEKEVKFAKDDRAKLNKFKDALESKRKDIKKQCLEPYENFNLKFQEVLELIDKPILAIDTQIKKFDDKVKKDKENAIKSFFDVEVGNASLKGVIEYDKISNTKWLNATYKMADIESEIMACLSKTLVALKTITDLKSDFELQIKDVYLRTFDLAQALQEKTRLEERKVKLEEHEQAYQKMNLQEQEKKQEQEQPHQQVQQQAEVTQIPQETKQIDFRIWATSEQLNLLKNFLIENNIKYGRVPVERIG